VRVVQTGRLITVPAKQLRLTVGKLVNGKPYSFTVAGHTAAGWSAQSARSATVYPTRPNIVLILTDDQRWDSLDQLPATNSHAWHRYANSFVVESMCCPSRSSTLTGRIPPRTGVDTQVTGARLDERKTFATMLHAAGYQTVFAGKYLNGYPFGRGAYRPPGWDKFYGMTGPTTYYNYKLIENSKYVSYGAKVSEYSTDVLRDKIVAASRAADPTRPLLLELAPNAPHRAGLFDPNPAARHKGVCADRDFLLPSNFNAYDTASEPTWMAGQLPRDEAGVIRIRQATCETLRAVDEAITAVINELARARRLPNTYIVITSDNGYHFGEHRLLEKGDLYDESVRVPLLVRGPDVEAGSDNRLTSNIDLAPTFLDWAKVTPPNGFFDGTSFATSARGVATTGPSAVLLRGCRTGRTPTGADGVCGGNETDMGKNWGLRTAHYKYVEYPDGYRQLFDIIADPFELTNLASDPAYGTTMPALHNQMVAMGAVG
jgi:arylsulfatase A-like enzyme